MNRLSQRVIRSCSAAPSARRGALLLLTALMAWSTVCPAQVRAEPDRGRLPDGRAFRTDAEGNQLVDYIAELELSIETLNRRVAGLEDLLQEKESQLSRLERGQTASAELRERDLVAAASAQPVTVFPPVRECPKVECPDCAASSLKSSPGLDCTADLQSQRAVLDSRVTALESQLSQERQQNGARSAELQSSLAQSQALRAGLLKREQELDQTRQRVSQLEMALAVQQGAAQAAEQKRVIAEREREQERQRTEEVKAQAEAVVRAAEADREREQQAQREREIALRQADLAQKRADEEAARRQALAAVRVEQKHPYSPLAESGAPDNDSLLRARNRAIEATQIKMREEVAHIRSAISQRDDLYRTYSQQPRTVGFKPSAALSSKKRGLDEIVRLSQASESMRDLAALNRELAEIRASIEDDIRLMKRMLKL